VGIIKIKEDDVFGYISQGYLYSQSKNKDFGGWIVINKASGEWVVCEAPELQEEDKKEALDLAKKNLKAELRKCLLNLLPQMILILLKRMNG